MSEPDSAISSGCTPTVSAYPDEDSDGVGAQLDADGNNRSIALCEEDSIPTGYSTTDGDCDDHDARAWKWVYLDQDGDGFRSLRDRLCVGNDVPPNAGPAPIVVEWTAAPGPVDCDDTDPNVVDFLYKDADGDGYGAGDPECHAEAAGWSAWNGDCNDEDASIEPSKVDYYDDGVDSDCDSVDGSSCVPANLINTDWTTPNSAPNASCTTPDLELSVYSCESCYRSLGVFAVENRGAMRVTAEVVVTGANAEPISIDLAPGERKLLLSATGVRSYTLDFVDSAVVDCNPADNTVTVNQGECI